MGLLSKFERAPPPTVIDYVGEAAPIDEEKAHAELQKGSKVPEQQQHHVDPKTEKRVVRKLDLRVTPLVTALCVFLRYFHHRILTPFFRPCVFPRPFKHWVSTNHDNYLYTRQQIF